MTDNQPSGRAASALATRRRVIDAAQELFSTTGYPDTTIRSVAQRAGVSPETVYKTFRNKAGLLKAAYDSTLAGDDARMPIADRPEARAMRAAEDPITAIRAYAGFVRGLTVRDHTLTHVVTSSRGSDSEVESFAATIDAERLSGSRAATLHWHQRGWLRDGLSPESAADQLWTLNSPAVHALLSERGVGLDDYERWLGDAVLAMIVDPAR